MATSNFLQWNNAAINQETDAEYLVDSQRVGGAPVTGTAPSKTMNKFYYQASTFVAAFGAMMAAKGFSVSDADVGVLQAVLANISTSADFRPLITTLGYSPTPNFAANTADGFQFPLNGNITSSTISGQTNGQTIAFYMSQDATGGRTIAWPGNFFGMTQPDPTPNAMSMFLVRVDNGGNVHALTPSISSANLTTVIGLLATALAVTGNADVGSLQIGGTAPAGQVLTGDGTHFVPAAPAAVTGTQNNVTGSRNFGGNYQNTSGALMIVHGFYETSGSAFANFTAFSDASATPSTPIWGAQYGATTATANAGFSFPVPAGHYYRLVASGSATLTQIAWFETTLD